MRKSNKFISLLLAGTMTAVLAGCGNSSTAAETTVAETTAAEESTSALPEASANSAALVIAEQGMFSSGGTVTEPVEGEFDETANWLDMTRAGNTAHVDHANVLYQIPENESGMPMVFLHGYGQSRMGWMTTPDGRDGWATSFLKKGHGVFLVDQPRRGEAGSTTTMTGDALDAWEDEPKDYKPGDQAWYTHFRIGRVAPDRYDGSQFPEGDEAQNQFFRQMTPNTGGFDLQVAADGLSAVMKDVYDQTGKKPVYVNHSQGGSVGWATDFDNISALVSIEPGSSPEVGSENYQRLLEADIPVIFYYGDYIDNGPDDIASTEFWKGARDGARAFAESFNADGGDCTVIYLPDEGITGNSHFMFQELNSEEIADHLAAWMDEKGLN
ncbi:alpha/beta fold hydrolase [Enterocloster asparagiformis]|uniref:alpha/beta hydrolase n=1 Tax=Enterocloster asparagiformis TaxID=333367 RepID=UPI0034ADFD42